MIDNSAICAWLKTNRPHIVSDIGDVGRRPGKGGVIALDASAVISASTMQRVPGGVW